MTTYTANGTTLGRGDGASPEVFTSVAQLQTIGSAGSERGLIDVTNLSSTAREYKKAIKDGLELQCVAQWDPDNATHVLIKDTDVDAELARNWRLTFTDSPATTATFAALVTRAVISGLEIDGVMMLEFTLKPTGDFTWA